MSWTIRRLGVDDLEAYRAIRIEALRDVPEAYGSSYEETSAQPERYFRVILERLAVFAVVDGDGQLGGIASFAQREGLKVQHAGDLISVYLRPHLRGTGCALPLIETVVAHARDHVIQLHLGVGTHNIPAIRLYQKAGFEITGTEPRALFVNGRFVDEHQMVRFLEKAPGDQT